MLEIIELTKENHGRCTKDWNDYCDSNNSSTFFHTLTWKKIIENTYNFKPMYLLCCENGKVMGVAPFFLTESILFGKKIISTPFNFYNGILYDDKKIIKKFIDYLLKCYKNTPKNYSIEYIQIKNLEVFDNEIINSCRLNEELHYNISFLDLNNVNYTKRLTKNLRTIHRNADKNNIYIREAASKKDIQEWHYIMTKTLRDKHNMISQPLKLFYNIYEICGDSMKLFLSCIKKNENEKINDKMTEKIIGGTLLFFYKNQAVYAWGASDQAYKEFSPNTILVDYHVNYCMSKKFSTLDFGVTSPEHPSLLKFKESFGCVHKKLPFYYLLLNNNSIPHLDYHTSFKTLRKPFKYVPIPLINAFSPYITKHLT